MCYVHHRRSYWSKLIATTTSNKLWLEISTMTPRLYTHSVIPLKNNEFVGRWKTDAKLLLLMKEEERQMLNGIKLKI